MKTEQAKNNLAIDNMPTPETNTAHKVVIKK
ncbi:hypothetical protein OCHUTO_0978 [Orientia chuto str. Dubai]|uniref:Uncharacterized protein n=1 Tax=Orientia chuto str. Dubai TaxID=1359168 RepID=A0A0F3MKJ5_9RICK|nr:hypothetical protein OCHUTO_0978 [Orientia chuto str. Dubai]